MDRIRGATGQHPIDLLRDVVMAALVGVNAVGEAFWIEALPEVRSAAKRSVGGRAGSKDGIAVAFEKSFGVFRGDGPHGVGPSGPRRGHDEDLGWSGPACQVDETLEQYFGGDDVEHVVRPEQDDDPVHRQVRRGSAFPERVHPPERSAPFDAQIDKRVLGAQL